MSISTKPSSFWKVKVKVEDENCWSETIQIVIVETRFEISSLYLSCRQILVIRSTTRGMKYEWLLGKFKMSAFLKLISAISWWWNLAQKHKSKKTINCLKGQGKSLRSKVKACSTGCQTARSHAHGISTGQILKSWECIYWIYEVQDRALLAATGKKNLELFFSQYRKKLWTDRDISTTFCRWQQPSRWKSLNHKSLAVVWDFFNYIWWADIQGGPKK